MGLRPQFLAQKDAKWEKGRKGKKGIRPDNILSTRGGRRTNHSETCSKVSGWRKEDTKKHRPKREAPADARTIAKSKRR